MYGYNLIVKNYRNWHRTAIIIIDSYILCLECKNNLEVCVVISSQIPAQFSFFFVFLLHLKYSCIRLFFQILGNFISLTCSRHLWELKLQAYCKLISFQWSTILYGLFSLRNGKDLKMENGNKLPFMHDLFLFLSRNIDTSPGL